MMKKIFGILVLSFIALSAVQAQSVKFAHVNTDELIPLMPEYDSAIVVLEDLSVKLSNELELMQVELNNKVVAYNNDVNNYTAAVRQAKEQELNDLNNRIQAYQATAQEEMEVKQNELVRPIYTKIQNAINAVGQENGFTYIFEYSYLRYINPSTSTDAMPMVKAKLGIQ
ncbi:MAG: OmpH family outer membrane protein [Bacteroidales bacterium]|jgi:outer membrane protein|nr:OmpH family outer membrane protein [Bacteroidota bacterium]